MDGADPTTCFTTPPHSPLLAVALGYPDDSSGWSRLDNEAVLVALHYVTPSPVPPGREFSYDNTGYILLTELLQAVCGQGAAHLAQAHLFEPLDMARTGSFSPYDQVLNRPPTNPWRYVNASTAPVYEPDFGLLGELLTVPVAAGAVSESGSFANGIDAWIAQEFRRAGFSPYEVWPRPTRPRVLPRDIALLLEKLPIKQSAELARRVENLASGRPGRRTRRRPGL